ncbi:hypothetical protein GHK28_19490 [Sinorhizobium medicae]|nr:hypothetical protein [Sinorhizobium medicae]
MANFMQWCGFTAICSSHHSSCRRRRGSARVIKRYHPPVPPVARVLAHPGVTELDKERLRAMMENADPVLLFAGIRAAQEELGRRIDRRGLHAKCAFH